MHAPEDDDRESRLNELLLTYVEALERGENPNRGEFIAAHPEFAHEIASFFDDLQAINRLSAPLRAAALAEDPRPPRPASFEGRQSTGAPTESYLPNAPPLPGERGRVGDFRLIREVGRGGMGVVYEAEQLSLKRRVALKILPFAAAFDTRHLQRFRNEAMAAAQLHHTAIVPVYAVGAESGVHYYAMQFIEGQSLAELIDGLRQHHDLLEGLVSTDAAMKAPTESDAGRADSQVLGDLMEASRRRKHQVLASAVTCSVSTEHRARSKKRRFFERVARIGAHVAAGLDHAHQLGVVHRDVKPANLLVDSRGEVWITDFGLALFRDDVELTMTGELIGTLRFMSPEQATARRGLVDHRTDIYSLGVTLYELLTLAPAFDGRDRHDLLRRISQEEPKAPRAIDPTIPVELETVILKAIAKEPAERYATAREMADDLRRFIDDKPVLARRPTWTEVVARWGRRHRGMVIGSVASLLIAVVTLAIVASFLAHEHAVTKSALAGQEQKAREAEEQRALAQANFESARKAVDFFVELSQEELLESPPMWDVRRRLLDASVRYYRELSEKRADDPSLQRELASSEARLADLLSERAAMETLGVSLLLRDDAVRQELQLSSEQIARLPETSEAVVTAFFRRLDSDSGPAPVLRQEFVSSARAAKAALAELLTASQARRLRQISLQQPGPHAFSAADVLDELQLTEEQRQQVRDIQTATSRKMHRIMKPGRDWEDVRDAHNLAWSEANQRILALFTRDQLARWSAMTGVPFAASIDPFRLARELHNDK